MLGNGSGEERVQKNEGEKGDVQGTKGRKKEMWERGRERGERCEGEQSPGVTQGRVSVPQFPNSCSAAPRQKCAMNWRWREKHDGWAKVDWVRGKKNIWVVKN